MSVPQLTSVAIEVSGSVGQLRLNRPETLNAFDRSLMQDLTEAAWWFDRQKEVKVVILSGAGRAFCSGFHLEQFAAMSPEEARDNVDLGRRMIAAISAMRPITIAAVHGHCIGGGLVLTTACDFRYASDDARFRLPEAELGIPLAWGGIPGLLREAGAVVTAELVLLCNELTAEEALRRGLLNGVVAPERLAATASAVAEVLSRRSSLVLEATKKQIGAAKNNLTSSDYAFFEAHALHSALTDRESIATRRRYLEEART